MTFSWLTLASALLCLPAVLVASAAVPTSLRVYLGTYTGPKSQGIYLSHFDPVSGKLTAPELAAEAKNPSFLALHPNRQFLYAVGELSAFGGKPTGAVSAFRIEPGSGQLTLLNQQGSGGAGPCHLSAANDGRCVLVANYGSGSIAALPILADGRLGGAATTIQHRGSSVNAQRQAGPHAHFIAPDPANRFALACDLGLDKVLVYRLNQAPPLLVTNDPPAVAVPPGSGPRHLAFHPNGRWVYVINEMSSTVSLFSYDSERGVLRDLQVVSTLPLGFNGESTCAEVQVHPTGQFVYGSNRGHDSIAVFAVDPGNGKLTPLQHQPTRGKTPRHFAIDPSGRWLLAENQGSNSVVVFRLDLQTGTLTPASQSVEVGSPVCAVFVP